VVNTVGRSEHQMYLIIGQGSFISKILACILTTVRRRLDGQEGKKLFLKTRMIGYVWNFECQICLLCCMMIICLKD
jgi:hypothetical protein